MRSRPASRSVNASANSCSPSGCATSTRSTGRAILGPGFVSSHGLAFTAVREINTTFETGLSLPLGPVTLGLGHARTVAGENTPRKEVYALSAATSF